MGVCVSYKGAAGELQRSFAHLLHQHLSILYRVICTPQRFRWPGATPKAGPMRMTLSIDGVTNKFDHDLRTSLLRH